MTNEEAAKMLIAKFKCMERMSSGIDSDCNNRNCDNCDLEYEQGTIGQQKEALKMAIEALKKHPEHSQNTPQKQPDLEKFGVKTGETCADAISRQAAIDATATKIKKWDVINEEGCHIGLGLKFTDVIDMLTKLPSVHPDGIPLEWINKHLEWLDNCDNEFAQLAKVGIRAMVELWKKDRI